MSQICDIADFVRLKNFNLALMLKRVLYRVRQT